MKARSDAETKSRHLDTEGLVHKRVAHTEEWEPAFTYDESGQIEETQLKYGWLVRRHANQVRPRMSDESSGEVIESPVC